MNTVRTFNKQVPAAYATLFELIGSNPNGFVLSVENQDSLGTLVFKFQNSTDGGTTWTDIVFGEGEAAQTSFTLLSGAVVTKTVTDTSSRIRLQAYGDVMTLLSVVQQTPHVVADAATTIIP